MVPRHISASLRDTLSRFPAVALLGPRQVGKTTLAHLIAEQWPAESVYVDLELPSDRAKLSEPELYLSGHEGKLVILDEIHRAPGIFQILRSLIDRRRRKGLRSGQFLLLGSASMELLRQSSESLAGRIAYLELTPFLISEVRALENAADKLWVRGGFPDSFLADSEQASLEWRLAFIRTYVEHDIPELSSRIPGETVRRFWQMLAHNQGQLLHASRLASGLGVSGQTAGRYLDTLVDLLLVRRLPPWERNLGKRLVRSPKTYVRDSGIVHALLGIGEREQLLGHPAAGPSWEGFVVENLASLAPSSAKAWFYRTSAGAEIDLLLEISRGELWAVEVKRSISNPQPRRGFHLACEDLKAARRMEIYPGRERYKLDALTEAIPLESLPELF